MGQKVNPKLMRLGYIKDWNNNWFIEKNFFYLNILSDYMIKNLIYKYLDKNILSNIEIERSLKNTQVRIFTSKPGILLGKYNKQLDKIKNEFFILRKQEINILIKETKNINFNAQLISQNIAIQLEKRVLFKRVVRKLFFYLNKLNIKGIKIRLKGRMNGIEIARTEWFKIGRIPLHTFRADIDYGFSEAFTNFGIIGIKVWVFNGEIYK